ncbi:signal recognition particle-docking protein FtsY [Arachnia rubra]|uniref:Signal recognition particle receptor FtsY n=1 Tax=Arachnia rubra TaxID=1547448 RepID=A0ABX7Y2F8_9ACTN|nr:signal recognition particle-docking protein FtsY [Arachnia rubra]MBB1570437.1 signal recognition particle-docking protein FtsY [Propionibacterium sp.]MDO4644581.1 signal recognition particle-docking protein FtsY [Propionibacteriaceae bacterium]MBB1577029.1 signal recognition particle-docking protein FtsY [Propionibacterium sp.]QUC07069.1 signal recognition particle-docking protein FtsY [Arachnia rubra]BCR81314.1 signal recognition particle receptor FtsY [Arachnia rubra]
MADVIFWIVVAVVGLSLVAATLIIRYGKKELPPGEPREAIEAPQETPTEEEASPVAGEETPVAEEEPPVSELPEPEPTEPILDQPEEPRSRFARLRRRLASSNNVLARALGELLSVDRIDSETWDDFEATLIASDLGVGPTSELTEALRRELSIDGVSDPERARQVLRAELLKLVDPGLDRSLNLSAAEGDPAVVMVVGVNGTGKTTTVGKLARVLVAEGRSVMLGAADTFRAAAAEQLATWGERVGVETVSSSEGSDPASVAFDAVAKGKDEGIDVVLVDTAGRLHTKVGLMDELGKVKRVIEKKAPVGEVLLVLDATTGQNGMTQARIFSEVVDVTGIVLTKLDGSAKGGIVIQVQRELGVPVKLVGLGEGVDDLAPFDPEGFVAGILGE